MGFRFQRRIRLFPGLRLNLSASGLGFSLGTRGLHVGITSRGQRYTSVGLPGTGISWREYEHIGKQPAAPRCDLCQPGHVHVSAVVVLVVLLLGFLAWLGRA